MYVGFVKRVYEGYLMSTHFCGLGEQTSYVVCF
jgi:hypothetical protein